MKPLSIILFAIFICGCASAPRGARELPPEIIKASERIAAFHENPSPQAFNEIIASHPKTLRWCRRNGNPGDVDVLWAAFFATGGNQYLDRLADSAMSSDSALIADAAKWSLNSNYRQHPAVQQYFDQRPEKKDAIIYIRQDAPENAPADTDPDR